MRFGRLGVLLLALGTQLSLADVASAKGGNRSGGCNGCASNGARVGPNDPAPTYGPNAPPGSFERRHNRPEIWARNSDPIVAERPNRPGKYYDARTQPGRERGTLNAGEVADANNRAGLYDQQPNIVTLGEASTQGEVGLNAGPFQDGRWNLAGGNEGDPGRLSLDVLRAEGTAKTGFGATDSGGVQAYVDVRGQATLVGLNGEIGGQTNVGGVNLNGKASGQAYIGADAQLIGQATIDRNGVLLNGRAGAFAGAKATGQLEGGAELGGNSAKVAVLGEISYGIGAQAEGYFKFDWATWSVKYGGRANVTLGVGAGVGVQGELNLSGVRSVVMEKIPAVASAVADGVSSVANTVGGAISDAASSVGSFFSGLFGGSDPPPVVANNNAGSNVDRNTYTQGGTGNDGPGVVNPPEKPSKGVGQRRD